MSVPLDIRLRCSGLCVVHCHDEIKRAGDLLAFYVIEEWAGGEEGAAVDEWERLTGPIINPFTAT